MYKKKCKNHKILIFCEGYVDVAVVAVGDQSFCAFWFLSWEIAGIYETNNEKRLFAVCSKYINDENIKILPKGKYLCANCDELERDKTREKLISIAKNEYLIESKFIVEIIVLTGILKWDYQIQIFVEKNK